MIILGIFRMLACLPIAAAFTACGQIQVAGGTSEVGNPSSALYDDGKPDDQGDVIGIAISAQGSPLGLIREKQAGSGDSAQAQAAPDTLSTPAAPEIPEDTP